MTQPMTYENGGFRLISALHKHIEAKDWAEVNKLLEGFDIENCSTKFRAVLIQGLAPVGQGGYLDNWYGLRDRAHAAFVKEGADADGIMEGMMDA